MHRTARRDNLSRPDHPPRTKSYETTTTVSIDHTHPMFNPPTNPNVDWGNWGTAKTYLKDAHSLITDLSAGTLPFSLPISKTFLPSTLTSLTVTLPPTTYTLTTPGTAPSSVTVSGVDHDLLTTYSLPLAVTVTTPPSATTTLTSRIVDALSNGGGAAVTVASDDHTFLTAAAGNLHDVILTEVMYADGTGIGGLKEMTVVLNGGTPVVVGADHDKGQVTVGCGGETLTVGARSQPRGRALEDEDCLGVAALRDSIAGDWEEATCEMVVEQNHRGECWGDEWDELCSGCYDWEDDLCEDDGGDDLEDLKNNLENLENDLEDLIPGEHSTWSDLKYFTEQLFGIDLDDVMDDLSTLDIDIDLRKGWNAAGGDEGIGDFFEVYVRTTNDGDEYSLTVSDDYDDWEFTTNFVYKGGESLAGETSEAKRAVRRRMRRPAISHVSPLCSPFIRTCVWHTAPPFVYTLVWPPLLTQVCGRRCDCH